MLFPVLNVSHRVSVDEAVLNGRMNVGLGAIDPDAKRISLSTQCPADNRLDVLSQLGIWALDEKMRWGLTEQQRKVLAMFVCGVVCAVDRQGGLKKVLEMGAFDVSGPVPIEVMTKTVTGRTASFPRGCLCGSAIPPGAIVHGPERTDPATGTMVCDVAGYCFTCEAWLMWAELTNGFKRPGGQPFGGEVRRATGDESRELTKLHPEKCGCWQVGD